MYNTIILKRGESRLTEREYKMFDKGNTIWGGNSEPEEVIQWSIAEEEEAKAELAKHRCEYIHHISTWDITEYALEYCEYDECGEFLGGSDYYLAEEK